jgi:uncharacterized membrane-anchored protein
MSEYSVVAERLRWEYLPTDALDGHPWYKEYVKRRLDPTFRMSTDAERLLAALHGILMREEQDLNWLYEIESTAKDYE